MSICERQSDREREEGERQESGKAGEKNGRQLMEERDWVGVRKGEECRRKKMRV